MATNDITFKMAGAFSVTGTRRYKVLAGNTINPGEPVYTVPNQPYVWACPTNSLTLAQGYLIGVAESSQTATASANGYVDVFPAVTGVIYQIAPKVAATFGLTPGSENQTTYDGLIGARVLLDLTSSTYTILATDNAANSCVIEYTDVTKAGGKVAFSFRPTFYYLQ